MSPVRRAPIASTRPDHALVGQPDTTRLEAAIRPLTGDVLLRRLVEVFGADLWLMIGITARS